MRFAPAIHPDLVALAGRLDDGHRVIAEIWRVLGWRARKRGLLQPSYESVRRIVHRHRAAMRITVTRVLRAVALTTEFLWHARRLAEITATVIESGAPPGRPAPHRRRASPRGGA